MRIGIVGAGAIGCVVGGMLTRAGHDVTFIDHSRARGDGGDRRAEDPETRDRPDRR